MKCQFSLYTDYSVYCDMFLLLSASPLQNTVASVGRHHLPCQIFWRLFQYEKIFMKKCTFSEACTFYCFYGTAYEKVHFFMCLLPEASALASGSCKMYHPCQIPHSYTARICDMFLRLQVVQKRSIACYYPYL